MSSELYEALAAPFDQVHQRQGQGGRMVDYITGEQCVTRLNTILGVDRWSFRIKHHEINEFAYMIVVCGELTVMTDEYTVIREQFGAQKIKMERDGGAPLDIGDDYKAAATDALKKCASLVGIALYLSHKEEYGEQSQAPQRQAQPQQQRRSSLPPARGQQRGAPAQSSATPNGTLVCDECQDELKATNFKDGTSWSPQQLADFGRKKHNRVLCMPHYRKANEQAKQAPPPPPQQYDQDSEELPF